ncbi:MAG TPA: ABC transporter permease [Candidatus Nanoarchaeia archaeon]|nr:ABC transporter permease [Candidatus Nanoarchaeia archaeon]
MIKDYFSLAFGNLRHRGLRSWLTILGIFIGIAAVVALITLGQGLKTAITGQFGALSVDKLTIQNKQTGFAPPGSAVVEKLNENDLGVIRSVSGIKQIITRLIRVTNVEYNEISKFAYVADLPSDNDGEQLVYESFEAKIKEGRLLRYNDRGKLLLGSNYAKEGVFDREIRVGSDIKINGRGFEVVGILQPTSTFTINGAILIPNKDLKEILDIRDEFDLIVAQVQDKERIEEVADELERKLRKDRDEDLGEESFSVETPIQSLESVNTVLDIVNIVVIGIAAISLFVGGIGIANTMYTGVLERTKEIGIMKAIGAENRDILAVFVIEAGLLGLAGGIIGALIGLGGAIGASSIANQAIGTNLLAVSISYPLIIGAIAFSFFIGIVSGILPAIQASKLNVVDALRK